MNAGEEFTLIRAVAGEAVGPVMISVNFRDATTEAWRELFGAASATLLSCAQSLSDATGAPVIDIIAEIASAAATVWIHREEAGPPAKSH